MTLLGRAVAAAKGARGFDDTKSLAILLLASVVLAFALFAGFSRLPAVNVGDGSEYYALQRAVVSSGTPFMTPEAWDSYRQLMDQGDVNGLVPADVLAGIFPSLRRGDTADFNHFWAYPALAAAIELSSRCRLTTHESFLALHAALLALTFLLCARWHGVAGAAAFLLILFASPLLWFTIKVHTELFTVSLTTIAMAAAMKLRWPWAAVALALASTQNISFALPAAVASFICLANVKSSTLTANVVTTLAVSASSLLALAHPFYYWSRYGIPTPQLLAGGASLEDVSPLRAFNYLLDLDVGLLANWPLGLIAIAAFTGLAFFYRPKFNASFLLFVALYLLSCLIAQAATQNMNSGGTVNVARYGLWYLSLFFPLMVWIGEKLLERRSVLLTGCTVLIVALLAMYNFSSFSPRASQVATEATKLSKLVYSRFPSLIDPAHEIFFERYSGMGEVVPPRPSITVGPDCRKLLVLVGNGTQPAVLGRTFCGISHKAFRGFVAEQGGWNAGNLNGEDRYLVNGISATQENRPSLPRGTEVLVGGSPSPAREYLLEGWSHDEHWGVWSDGPRSVIVFRVEPSSADLRITLEASAFLKFNHPEIHVTAVINGVSQPRFTHRLSDPEVLRHSYQVPAELINRNGGEVTVVLNIDEPRSAASLDLSYDPRELGIGLIRIIVE